MRHALLILMLPLTLLLSGCCNWWDSDEEVPYHEVEVKNRTDQTVTIRYLGVTKVKRTTDEDGNDHYDYRHQDKVADLAPGKHKSIRVPLTGEVEIKAVYNGIQHSFLKDADALCPCDLTIRMDIEDFIPPVPPPMPVANG